MSNGSHLSAKAALVVFSLATLAACGAPKPPSLPIPQLAHDELTDDDYDVMSAVLDGIVRPEYRRSIQRGEGRRVDPRSNVTARVLVFDSTTPYCNPETIALRHTFVGCIESQLPLLDQISPAAEAVRRRGLFLTRNSRSLSIHGALGQDVVLVPSAIGDSFPSLSEYRRRYPQGGQVVVFSAPVYPTSGVAVIFYRAVDEGSGFVSLARVGDQWSIKSRNARVE